MAENMRVLIVGGVACGPKTACRLKRLLPEAKITLFEKGEDISYGACGMPYFISGMSPRIDSLSETPVGVKRNPGFFQKVKGVEIRCGQEAVAIDRAEKKLHVKERQSGKVTAHPYDKLVLATGAKPLRPPIPGIDAQGVVHFHSLTDAARLEEVLKEGRVQDVAIVGAGLIGLEMAEALTERGLKVTLVEMADYIMPALLDEEMARLAGKHLQAKGVKMALGSPVKEFVKDPSGHLAAVKTGSETFDADLALVAIGVSPNSGLAEEADLQIAAKGGININEFCQTSDENIYAGGDCVVSSFVDPALESPLYTPQGSVANKQGRIIANHIAGIKEPFPGVLGTVICKVFDYTIARTGLSEKRARELKMAVETVLCTGPDKPHYYKDAFPLAIKLVVERETRKLLGFQAVGPGDAAKRLDVAATALSFGATLDQIAHLDLGYAPPFSAPIDSLLTAAQVLQNKLDGVARGISPLEAKKRIDKGEVTLLDVRSPDEFTEAGLPYEVVHIPLGALREKADTLPKDREILTFCKVSLRGYEAQKILEEKGIKNVTFIEGGIVGWPFSLRTVK